MLPHPYVYPIAFYMARRCTTLWHSNGYLTGHMIASAIRFIFYFASEKVLTVRSLCGRSGVG
jgi:hypothetical protein